MADENSMCCGNSHAQEEERCIQCGSRLGTDEMAIYKRLVNRGASEFMCIDCLALHFRCPRKIIEERIRHFKEIGCTLFCKNESKTD